jgi:hypothetical protein
MNNEIAANSNPAPNIKFSDTIALTCSKCENEVFQPVVLFRKVSAIMSETGQEGLIPINAQQCTECKTLLQELLPDGLKDVKLTE